MIKRWQECDLRRNLSVRRGVHLTGARQCGKSTLAEFVADGKMRHLSLDEDMFLKAAKDDPATFVERRDGRTLVIDEIQKAPELLNAIKIKVDHDSSRGQYLITGSSNLHFVKAVSDSFELQITDAVFRKRNFRLLSCVIPPVRSDLLKICLLYLPLVSEVRRCPVLQPFLRWN